MFFTLRCISNESNKDKPMSYTHCMVKFGRILVEAISVNYIKKIDVLKKNILV